MDAKVKIKPIFFLMFFSYLIFMISCKKELHSPVTPVINTEYNLHKIIFRQTSLHYFEIKSQEDLIYPTQEIEKITYYQIERDEVLFSEQIDFEYLKVDEHYRIVFTYEQRTFSENDTLSFKLSFESVNEIVAIIDTTFILNRLKDTDFEEYFRFEALGEDFQDVSISTFDLRDNSIVFNDYKSSKVYEYNISTLQTKCIFSSKHRLNHIASNNDFTFINLDSIGIIRYNHNTDSLDLEIDLSQLDYVIGESKYSYGMNIFNDSLFVIFFDEDVRIQKISKFDLNGNYYGSFDVDNMAMGHIWSLAQFEDLIFTYMDTGLTIWNRFFSTWDRIYIPSYGNWGADCRIYDDWLYFIDNDDIFIYRVPMEKVVKVLFDTYRN